MSCRENEAKALAATIRAYWHVRGHSPLVWIDRQLAPSSASDVRSIYSVRSNMVGGWPSAIPSPALPKARLKINPGVTADSTSPLACLAGIRQRLKVIDSVRPSNRFSGGAGVGAA
jgi:hypothetical protein